MREGAAGAKRPATNQPLLKDGRFALAGKAYHLFFKIRCKPERHLSGLSDIYLITRVSVTYRPH